MTQSNGVRRGIRPIYLAKGDIMINDITFGEGEGVTKSDGGRGGALGKSSGGGVRTIQLAKSDVSQCSIHMFITMKPGSF